MVSRHPRPRAAHWPAVYALTLCVFALIASEFMPVSLLTPLAATMQVSEGQAGYGIAISGAFAVLTSLFIGSLAGSMNRRGLLMGLTALMVLSCLMVAQAGTYAVYMLGRALIGVVVGGFWSLSAAVAMRLVPSPCVPRALAIFNAGNALATVVAAPLGSYLGGIIGWRGAFYCLIPIALGALLWQFFSLPSMPAEPAGRRRAGPLLLLKRPEVQMGMAATSAFFMGQFILFTYLRPFLEKVTAVDVTTLSMMLAVIGVSGLVGTVFIGKVLKAGLYRTLAGIPIVMAAVGLALITWGAYAPVVFALLAIWGLLATAAPVGWWSWLAQTMPQDAEAGGGLMVAVIQLSIALGSTLGGLLYDAAGHRLTFIVSALVLAISACFAIQAGRQARAGTGALRSPTGSDARTNCPCR